MTTTTAVPEYRLRYYLQNTKPVELKDFTEALNALHSEYVDYAKSRGLRIKSGSLQVYEVRQGSIIVDLVDGIAEQGVFDFMTDSVVLFGFGQHLIKALTYLSGKERERPDGLTAKTCESCAKLMQPSAVDHGSNVYLLNIHGDNNTLHFHGNSTEANAVQNKARAEREQSKERVEDSVHEFAVIQFLHLCNDKSRADKGIIEAISPRKLSLVFDEGIKEEIVGLGEDNPFSGFYVVDVQELWSMDRLVAYRILKLHGRIDNEEEGEH